MSYQIAQSEKYVGNNYWSWSAWIEASHDELDQLDYVTWILHPTFSPSRIENRSRETNFRLDTSGWGTFMLRAQLHFKNKPDSQIVNRMLRLTYPDDEAVEVASGKTPSPSFGVRKRSETNNPTIFLSYSSEDESHAQQVRLALAKIGARVLDAKSIASDLPLEAAVRKMIRESDGVLSVIGSDYASPNVVAEIKMAKVEEKPVVTVLPQGVEPPSALFQGVEELRLGVDSSSMDAQLARFVGKLGSKETK
ncbi:MAG TPA: pYEATS domain-containing protein [Candidatus Acidoferrales bacterium]|nr:pYEATS domain-containing protein [Candidatus Acidoferrales bacterium]